MIFGGFWLILEYFRLLRMELVDFEWFQVVLLLQSYQTKIDVKIVLKILRNKDPLTSSSNENDNIENFDQIRSLKLMGKLAHLGKKTNNISV